MYYLFWGHYLVKVDFEIITLNFYRRVHVTRFMSEGHLLVIVINLPKIPLDQSLSSESLYLAQLPQIKDFMTYDQFFWVIMAIIVCLVVMAFMVVVGFYFMWKKVQKNNNDINKQLINESMDEMDDKEKLPLKEDK